MQVVLIFVSMAPSWQCATDALPAVWDHTVLPATRSGERIPAIYGRRARPPHITTVNVCEQIAQGR